MDEVLEPAALEGIRELLGRLPLGGPCPERPVQINRDTVQVYAVYPLPGKVILEAGLEVCDLLFQDLELGLQHLFLLVKGDEITDAF